MDLATCWKCGQEKALTEFGFYPSRGRREKLCKACERAKSAANHKKRQLREKGPDWKPWTPFSEDGRRCWRCKEVKPLSAYRTSPKAKSGVVRTCMSCEQERFLALKAARQANPERHRRLSREAEKRFRSRHPEKHRGKMRRISSRRRARRFNAQGDFTKADVDLKFILQGGACYYCKRPLTDGWHIEHKIPLSRGGSNWPANIAVACPSCNLKKGTKTTKEFFAS